MSDNLRKILIVEDDLDLGNILSEYIRIKGFDVILKRDGESVLENYPKFDLAILDISLPGMDGLELGERIKKKSPSVPFIFLTARTQKKDILHGLQLGADDYISKPFEVEELVLRVKNILKRTSDIPEEKISIGSLELDILNLTLSHQDGTINNLTEIESNLLALFIKNENVLLKRDYILNEVWGNDDYFVGRSMDVFVARIRKLIKSEPTLELINVRGIGFKLVKN